MTPAKPIIETLKDMKANVFVHDPYVDSAEVKSAFNVENSSLEDALNNSDCIVLHTFHKSFENLQITEIKEKMKDCGLIVDTQHVFSPGDVIKSGLKYRGLGRGGV